MRSSRWERYQQLSQTGEEYHLSFEPEKFFTADELSHKIYMYDGVCIKTRQRTRLGISENDAIADIAEK